MKIAILGAVVEPTHVIVYRHRFGSTAGFKSVPYELDISKAELTKKLRPIYSECVEELKRDDKLVGRFNPPYKDAIKYPDFDEFLSLDSKNLFEFVDTYFSYDILNLFFEDQRSALIPKWTLISIDSIRVDQEVVKITGLAHEERVGVDRSN